MGLRMHLNEILASILSNSEKQCVQYAKTGVQFTKIDFQVRKLYAGFARAPRDKLPFCATSRAIKIFT